MSLFWMKLILFWMFASIVQFVPPLWEYLHENFFLWFRGQCDKYLRTVEMPRLVRQSNCQYISLAERLRFIPQDRRFDRWILTKCLQVFRDDLDIEPKQEEPLGQMPWEAQKG